MEQVHQAELTVGGNSTPAPASFWTNLMRWLRVVRDFLLLLVLWPLALASVLRLLRAFWPIVRVPFGNLAIVTRYEHVEEVLTRDRIFHVEEERIKKLNRGESFLLGLQDGETYRRYQTIVMSLFRLEDIKERVADFAAARAREIVGSAATSLDAVRGLVTRIPIDICRSYYGVDIPADQEDQLAEDSFVVSLWLFDPRETTPGQERAAIAAGERINALVDASIAATRRAVAGANAPDTIAARLIRRQADDPKLKLKDEEIRVILVSMLMGFVPTNTMAGGHILEQLLKQPEAMRQARAAAKAGDDERLKRCLFEAMRFQPLSREPTRFCAEPYTLGEGSGHAKQIKRGMRVVPLTRSAMMDERRVERPSEFDPDRPAHHYMLFGYGLHRCIGAAIAEAQITQTFKPLLQQANLRRAAGERGKLRRSGPFPRNLFVEFDAQGARAEAP